MRPILLEFGERRSGTIGNSYDNDEYDYDDSRISTSKQIIENNSILLLGVLLVAVPTIRIETLWVTDDVYRVSNIHNLFCTLSPVIGFLMGICYDVPNDHPFFGQRQYA